MKVSVKKEVFKKLPDLKVVLVVAAYINNFNNLKEARDLVSKISDYDRKVFAKETIKNHNLIAPWVVAQEEFGKQAKHYHTSVENLLQKVLRNNSVLKKDTLSNIFNYLSLKHIIPGGVDDLLKIDGDLTFSVASGKEKAGLMHTIKRGAFYYRDDKGALGTKLDSWKSLRTKMTNKSVGGLLHFEILPPVKKKEMDALIKEASNLIETFCSGKAEVYVLDKKTTMVKI